MEPECSMFALQLQRGTHQIHSVSNGSCQIASIIHPQNYSNHAVHPVSPLLHININHPNCKWASRHVETEACCQVPDAGGTQHQGTTSLPQGQRCCFSKAGKGAQAFAAGGEAHLHFLSDVLFPPSLV